MQKKTITTLSIALFITFLTWGVYSMLVYLGVPVHGKVLLPDPVFESLAATCQGSELLCRGMYSIVPFIANTFTRLQVFTTYAILCAVIYVLYLGWYGLRQGTFMIRWHLRPWKIFVLFILMMALLFTVLGYSNFGDTPFRRVVEPTDKVYNVGPEALQTLKENFTRLESAGCLTHIGNFDNGANVYNMKGRCIAGSFIKRVLPPVLLLLVLVLELLTIGRFLLHRARLKPKEESLELVMSLGAGACFTIAVLWILAVAHIYTSIAGWLLIIAIPIIGWKHALHWIRQFFHATWTVEKRWYSLIILLGWLLLSYLALNYINVVRPFPIGWDDLGSYVNRPRLMVSYGHFVYSMAPFQWEYLTSLGFLLFGYNSFFGATFSMMINWLAGPIAILVIFVFVRKFLGIGHGVLSALLYYMLPMVGHFSFADMKIDNAVFFMGALATFMVFLYLFSNEEDGERQSLKYIALAGVFAGFAFAFKATGVMVLMGIGAVLLGAMLHWTAFLGAVVGTFAVFALQRVLDIKTVVERVMLGVDLSQMGFVAITVIIGGALIAYGAYLGRKNLKRTAITILIFGAAFTVSVAPWILHNNFLRGQYIPKIELGALNTFTPIMDMDGTSDAASRGYTVRTLPPELRVDRSHEKCSATGAKEELGRYWGFATGWKHYLTLPWRNVNNMDSAGYYVTTMSALLLFPMLLLLPYFWMKKARWMRWLFVGTLFLLLQWMMLANGIPWYGIGMFLGLVVGLEVLISQSPDTPNRVIAAILIGISILAMLNMRFWQFDLQRNLYEYPLGKVTAEALRERTIPHYDDITDIVLERNATMPDRPYLYRVGTFMPYFIPRNLEIIGVADHQLDFFNCLHQEERPDVTVERLKALGFNSIVFDTNTATIERDPNGSLHRKVATFVHFLNNPLLRIVLNDPGAGIAYVLIP